jgi:transketolase
MAEKKATRAVYGEMLVELAEKYPELIVLDADLSSATMTKSFAKAYPGRFLDMGIAEANMIGVAAGLATCGKKPFANSFAMFTAGRAYEQVRNSVAYPGLNVKCVGSHGGLSVGEDGATHQCLEDLALMSAIPGMLVVNPCDGNEMRQAMLALIEYVGPAYMRLGRMAVENVTDAVEGYKFELGKAAKLREGRDLTICATGLMVQRALAAAETLQAEGISARVLDFHTVKPIDKAALDAAAKETGCIVTTEEHNVMGGLGSAIAAYIAETNPVPVLRHGVYDEFGRSGKAEKVLEAYGLTAEGIAAKARSAVAMKR